jgi:heme oxygenase (biliverdin-IX-beta and delta-forming)
VRVDYPENPLAESDGPLDMAIPLSTCAFSRLSARAVLREATNAIHERMHWHPGISQVARGTIGREEYRHLLNRTYGFYSMAEPLLGLPGGQTDALSQDLADLGMSAAEIKVLRLCAAPMIGRRLTELAGAQYVLLGASLGGKAMARAIVTRSSGKADLPIRFLSGNGAGDWQTFVVRLEALLPDQGSRAQAAEAAFKMFAAYESWMDGWLEAA